jgi:murein DD-endopeptidase MepM/ murein hydrolase activator NlpD
MRTTTDETEAGKRRACATALAAVCLCALAACASAQPAGSLNSAASAAGAVAANLRAAAQSTPQSNATPASNTTAAASNTQSDTTAGAPTQTLLVPVAGVRPEDLQDTYAQARAGGRVHDAIDITAAAGTPVLAAADGTIVKLFNSVPGGITVYQSGTDGHTIYYYAHLQRYADGLAEGHFARRGETIAYVGDTGNAGAGNYHLHFSVSTVSDSKRWWSGTNVNPYPLLTGK